jgi:hypothetical protein
VGIVCVAEGRHERSGRSASGQWREWWAGALRRGAGAGVALRGGDQGVDVIMLGYHVQGSGVVGNNVHVVGVVVGGLASFCALEDGGRHVESGA